MISPAERVQILKAENRRLEAYLRELPHERWGRPSPCAEWTVADVIAHITSFNLDYAGRILKTLSAGGSGPVPVVRTTNDRTDATLLASHPIELRKELGDGLFARYLEANRAIEDAFDRVGPDDWAKLCPRRFGAEPLTSLIDVFIVDVGVHRWDVISPFDPDVRLSPEGLPVMVERYRDRPRWWDLPLPEQHPALPARFRFEITDIAVSASDFVVDADGEERMEQAGTAPATVLFRCDAEMFVLLGYGRIKPTAAVAAGRLTYTGDRDWADVFLRGFVGG